MTLKWQNVHGLLIEKIYLVFETAEIVNAKEKFLRLKLIRQEFEL